MNEKYERYLQDDKAIIKIDEKNYYRALEIVQIRDNNTVEIAVDNKLNLKTGDILVDDNDNEYVVRDCPFFCFRGGIPEWHSNISIVVIQGNIDSIGHYFTKQ